MKKKQKQKQGKKRKIKMTTYWYASLGIFQGALPWVLRIRGTGVHDGHSFNGQACCSIFVGEGSIRACEIRAKLPTLGVRIAGLVARDRKVQLARHVHGRYVVPRIAHPVRVGTRHGPPIIWHEGRIPLVEPVIESVIMQRMWLVVTHGIGSVLVWAVVTVLALCPCGCGDYAVTVCLFLVRLRSTGTELTRGPPISRLGLKKPLGAFMTHSW